MLNDQNHVGFRKKIDFPISDDIYDSGVPHPQPPRRQSRGKNNFLSFDTMDFIIKALLDGNLVIEKLAKKTNLMNFHLLYPP